jgi:hypothetical protein
MLVGMGTVSGTWPAITVTKVCAELQVIEPFSNGSMMCEVTQEKFLNWCSCDCESVWFDGATSIHVIISGARSCSDRPNGTDTVTVLTALNGLCCSNKQDSTLQQSGYVLR